MHGVFLHLAVFVIISACLQISAADSNQFRDESGAQRMSAPFISVRRTLPRSPFAEYEWNGFPAISKDGSLVAIFNTSNRDDCEEHKHDLILLDSKSGQVAERLSIRVCEFDDDGPTLGNKGKILPRIQRANDELEKHQFSSMQALSVHCAEEQRTDWACGKVDSDTQQQLPVAIYSYESRLIKIIASEGDKLFWEGRLDRLYQDCGPSGSRWSYPNYLQGWIDVEKNVAVIKALSAGVQDYCTDSQSWKIIWLGKN